MQAFRAAEAFDGSAFLGPTTVLVDGESIVGVERGHPDLPDGVEVATYDGTLLPGLFDCHVHLVATSVVGSLERGGSMRPTTSWTPGSARAWRRSARAG